MGLEINAFNAADSVNSNISVASLGIPTRQIPFGSYVTKPDSINVRTDADKYLSPEAVSKMVMTNPDIRATLQAANLPLKINYKALKELSTKHLDETKKITMGVVNNLPADYRKNVDTAALQRAAILHDLGKVLIPDKVLNKAGKFTPQEMDVMRRHANLGYEMLKTTDLDAETLRLVKYHHQNGQRTGYPKAPDDYVSDINAQILAAADMYSALREKRVYKEAFTKNQALGIVHQKVKSGEIHPYVFKALVDYANKYEA